MSSIFIKFINKKWKIYSFIISYKFLTNRNEKPSGPEAQSLPHDQTTTLILSWENWETKLFLWFVWRCFSRELGRKKLSFPPTNHPWSTHKSQVPFFFCKIEWNVFWVFVTFNSPFHFYFLSNVQTFYFFYICQILHSFNPRYRHVIIIKSSIYNFINIIKDPYVVLKYGNLQDTCCQL